jgi:hypothetical protein
MSRTSTRKTAIDATEADEAPVMTRPEPVSPPAKPDYPGNPAQAWTLLSDVGGVRTEALWIKSYGTVVYRTGAGMVLLPGCAIGRQDGHVVLG